MATNTRITRASNKDTHPGMPDIDEEVLGKPIPKPRRTKAQIAADSAATSEKNSAKAEEVKLNNERRTQLIEQIAILEKKMHDEEQQPDREAARPPEKEGIVSVVHPLLGKCTITHSFKHVICLGNLQLHRKKKVLSGKRLLGQNRTTSMDQRERKYQPLVRFRLCLTSVVCADHDDDIERNITSSDVEFLEGEDKDDMSDAKTSKKDKPEKTRASIHNALTTPNLSGLEHTDVNMNISESGLDMSVLFWQVDKIVIDKELTFSHTAQWFPQIASPQPSSEGTLANLSQWQGMFKLKHKYPLAVLLRSLQSPP
jgi:hypothetical protein